MKARIFVKRQYPKLNCIRTYESISAVPRIATGWVITDGERDFGVGKTKTDAWNNAKKCIENDEITQSRELSKIEAITCLRDGKTLTHDYFTDDEYMYMDDNELVFEDGVRTSLSEFFKYRTEPSWETGYRLCTRNTEKSKINEK